MISRKLWIGPVLLVFACLTVVAQARDGKPSLSKLASRHDTHSQPWFAPDRLIVRFRPGKSASARATVHAYARGRSQRGFDTMKDIELVQLKPEVPLAEALRLYRSRAEVLYAEPDYRRILFDVVPNDPLFTTQWNMRNSGQNGGAAGVDIDAVKAWGLSMGSSGVVVGTIDTGVDWNHADLAANVYRNEGDCTENGIDDDGNGFIDDCHGFNASAGKGDPVDTYKHGTHVAGIIGAAGNNGVGVVGVNWQVKVLACKSDDEYGNLWDSVILACLDYMATMKDRGVNIVATNNSYGGLFESKAVTDAIREQMNRGLLFVAAAANYGVDNDAFPIYPANTDLPNVLTVAATDNKDGLGDFSDYGRHSVHLAAPGVAITSTVPDGGYDTWDGTSMASPHVAGAAALLTAQNPALDWAAIKNRILAGGDVVGALAATISGRRLNVYGAMTCSGKELLARIQPQRSNVSLAIGGTVAFRMLHILCAQPAGEVSVSINEAAPFTLHDDGKNGDDAAGDGVYSARWVPPAPGRYTATFSNGEAVTISVLKPYIVSPTEYEWRTIGGTYVALDWFYGQPVKIAPPFPVRFGGAQFDSLAMDAYGTVEMLGGDQGAGWGMPEVPFPLPTALAGTLISPLWDDVFDSHDIDSTSGFFWDVLGKSPNRELVLEWRKFHHYTEYSYPPAPSTATFQAVFSESNDDVLFNYADVSFENEWYDNGGTASVGIQVSQDVGMQFSCYASALAPELALRWSTSDTAPTSIEILWPNGGEVWRPGQKRAISWNATGPAATDFRIELLKADAIASVIAAAVPASSGSFVWTIPTDTLLGDDYKIRLVSNSDPAITHTSLSNFMIGNAYVLEVWMGYMEGGAMGTITSSPAGLDCHAAVCHAPFAAGTTVTLRAVPDSGNAFTGWNPPCSGTGTCVITMTSDMTIAADFTGPGSSPDFAFGTPPAPQTISAGGSTDFTLTLSGSNGFSGTVQFACSSGLPNKSSCAFSPNSVTIGANPVSTTLTIHTSAGSTAVLRATEKSRPMLALLLPLVGLLSCGALWDRSTRRRTSGILTMFIALSFGLLLGCGGGGGSGTATVPQSIGTQPGSYSVTVTASSGAVSHTQVVKLTVQ